MYIHDVVYSIILLLEIGNNIGTVMKRISINPFRHKESDVMYCNDCGNRWCRFENKTGYCKECGSANIRMEEMPKWTYLNS